MSKRGRKKKNFNQEEGGGERWLVSYADFITLLFAFFVILYATSENNSEKVKEFQDSVQKYLSQMVQGEKSGASIQVNVVGSGNSRINSPLSRFSKTGALIQKTQKKMERQIEDELSSSSLKKMILDITEEDYGVKLSLSADYIFSAKGARFRPEAIKALKILGSVVSGLRKPLRIEGHTDDRPMKTSRYPSNWDFSAARAAVFTRYLVKVHGVDSSKISPIGFGEARPVLPNISNQNRRRNRRLDIYVLVEDLGL